VSPFTQHALHNEEFHTATTKSYPDKYFDWKVVMIFYAGLHYVKGLAHQLNISIGESHMDIRNNIQPPKANQRIKPAMAFTKRAYDNYDLLYEASRNARYSGFRNPILFEQIMEEQNTACLKALKDLKSYIKDRGLTISA
jgi:hypothetical protein